VSTLAIVLVVAGVVVLALIVGGLIASARFARADDPALRRDLEEADHALALARAQDKGWDRDAMEAVVRGALAARGEPVPKDLLLVQVVDRPGTEQDEALFRAPLPGGDREVRLVRRGEAWIEA
jgi:hypothetical protein